MNVSMFACMYVCTYVLCVCYEECKNFIFLLLFFHSLFCIVFLSMFFEVKVRTFEDLSSSNLQLMTKVTTLYSWF